MYILKTRFKSLISRLNIPKVMIGGEIQFISLLYGLGTHINLLYSYENIQILSKQNRGKWTVQLQTKMVYVFYW